VRGEHTHTHTHTEREREREREKADLLILGEFALDHKGLNVVDGMHVVHAVNDHL